MTDPKCCVGVQKDNCGREQAHNAKQNTKMKGQKMKMRGFTDEKGAVASRAWSVARHRQISPPMNGGGSRKQQTKNKTQARVA